MSQIYLLPKHQSQPLRFMHFQVSIYQLCLDKYIMVLATEQVQPDLSRKIAIVTFCCCVIFAQYIACNIVVAHICAKGKVTFLSNYPLSSI